MLANLAIGFTTLGRKVEIWTYQNDCPFMNYLPKSVALIVINKGKTGIEQAATRLDKIKPAVMLTSKEENFELALSVCNKAKSSVPLIFRAAMNHEGKNKQRGSFRAWRKNCRIRKLYPKADHVIAVSSGVKEHLVRLVGLLPDQVSVIPNPVIHDGMLEQSRESIEHPWFLDDNSPVIIGVGRLSRQKNFSFLIDAFSRVRQFLDCRLMIIGEGRYQARLKRQVQRLGISEHVEFMGFQSNPYAFMARADIFVLSSLWEGSPNVLTEALALGIPSVATDCPSGPKEILDHGRFGFLVEMNDIKGMADAILKTITDPPPPEKLKKAVSDYTIEESSRRYLNVIDAVVRSKKTTTKTSNEKLCAVS